MKCSTTEGSQRGFEISGRLFRVFRVIFLRVIWWIVLLAYNTKTIHEGTRTITKKHEEQSLQDFDVGFLFNPGQRSLDIFTA